MVIIYMYCVYYANVYNSSAISHSISPIHSFSLHFHCCLRLTECQKAHEKFFALHLNEITICVCVWVCALKTFMIYVTNAYMYSYVFFKHS